MSTYNQEVVESRVKVEIASKTYNRCTNDLVEEFNLQISKSLSPRERFLEAVESLKNILHNEINNKRSLDDFSRTELQFAFLFIADLCFQEARNNKVYIEMTRENFVRDVCKFLEDNFGFKVERLHIKAKTGRYQRLKKYFRWLLVNTPVDFENGSKPSSKLVFSP